MSRSLSLAALAVLTAVSGRAFAADIIEEPVPIQPELLPVASGWYLRGDVGYVFKDRTEGDWDFWNIGVYNPDSGGYDYRGIDDTYRYDKIDFGKAPSFGGGVGYRYNEFLRGDATLDYFRAKVSGGTACPYMVKNDEAHGFLADPTADDCSYGMKSKADVWTMMANAYVDLPVFGPIVVPYIGAGIGAAYVDYDDMKNKESCSGCPASYDPYKAKNEGLDDWRFASSLMAGAAVDLTGALKLDAGYKYTHVGSGDAFGYDDADKKADAHGTQIRDNGFDLHAVRVGLRYEFY